MSESEADERLQEIRRRVEDYRIEELSATGPTADLPGWYWRYAADVPYLLERVAELQRENGRLRGFMGRTNLRYSNLGRRNLLKQYDRMKKGGYLDAMETPTS